MADGRFKNNLSAGQRRAIAKTAMRKKSKKQATELDRAKNVLRRHGKTVCDAWVLDPRFKGTDMIFVDERKMTAKEVIALGTEIERREAARNAELRRQYGLK